VLDRVRAGALADAGERHLARVAIQGGGAHLDQLVVRKRPVDLGDDRVGEALLADLQDRVEGVGTGFERLALGGGERGFHERGMLAQPNEKARDRSRASARNRG